MVLEIAVIAKEVGSAVLSESVSAIIDRYKERQREAAFDELMVAVRAGRKDLFDAIDEHSLARAFWKYFCAARDGAARRNLRLLARTLVDLVDVTAHFADEFDRYAPVLARLRPDHIVMLVRIQAAYDAVANQSGGTSNTAIMAVSKVMLDELPSTLSKTFDAVVSTGWELVALGLLAPEPLADGAFLFRPTDFARAIIRHAALEATLAGD